MKRWLKDPLLHFFAGGVLLFAAYGWLNPPARSSERQVRIGAGELRWLAATWHGQSGRAPSADELRELVSSLVKEELLAREAREMRLDENDTIVRRRLAQKLEFMLQDTVRVAEPTEEQLRRLYAAAPGAFPTEARVSFTQIFFKRREDAMAALPKLVVLSPAAAARTGDRLMVEATFEHADRQSVAAAFGPEFARAVFELRPGAWRGPVESGYGAHLVKIDSLEPGRPRDFAEARPLLAERWRQEEQARAEARFFQRLMEKYEVRLDDDVKAALGGPLELGRPR